LVCGALGTGLTTPDHLDFQLAHARARDAVYAQLDAERIIAELKGDGPYQRNLEFEGRRAGAFLQCRQDGQPHAAIEQRRPETTVHAAGRIEVGITWFRIDDNPPALR